jgi:pilus assembly protein Flp/PilA
MQNEIRKFMRDDEGLTTVEYAVGGALISIAVVGSFVLLAGGVTNAINLIAAVLP